ncbi:uncharacterized protein LOC132706930 [Cylas formicarius]|uniref:uncharacterized protein LOC132706930 n=1 Tax=Cylas formicarius TaxID=197179 RepID=UPI002958BE33|nr:uncharacterized protein LOC132706930 [Cylas formicarius]
MTVQLRKDQLNLIRKSAEENSLENFDIEADKGTIKGDNYLGEIYTIRVREKNSERILNMILKSATTNGKMRDVNLVKNIFSREAFLYQVVLPELYKLQEEKGITDGFTGSARCYGTTVVDCEESILMENLKTNGFKLWERRKPMDEHHIELVFSEYARFHATSMALRQLKPEKFSKLSENLGEVFETDKPEVQEQLKSYTNSLFQSILEVVKVGDPLRMPVENFCASQEQFFEDMNREKCVITHGDCWTNNMLFKYEGPDLSKPTRVCFLDWQLSTVGTPAKDLAYFFCVCTPRELLYNYRKYFKLYYETLSKNLKEFGCDPDQVFSYETLMQQWKKYAKYGLFVGIMVLKVMLSDESEVPELGDMKVGDHLANLFKFGEEKERLYRKRVIDVVKYLVDHDLIYCLISTVHGYLGDYSRAFGSQTNEQFCVYLLIARAIREMTVQLREDQLNLIRKSAYENGFENFDIEADKGTIKGDNYLGEIYTIRVREKNGDRVLNLILKSASTNAKLREVVVIKNIFSREAFLYQMVLPELYKLQEDKAISDRFTGSAKCYGTTLVDQEESILMENLKSDGFKLWERRKPMDEHHIELVFSEYARYHAASMALKQLKPEKFSELSENLGDVFATDNPSSQERWKAYEQSVFQSILEVVNDDDRLRMSAENFRDSKDQFFEDLKQEKYVITHGDCWTNNMLFKYEGPDPSKPTRVCFLDWQLSAVGTPVTDLAYFFCVCASRELLYNYRKYFKLYHEILSRNLKELGCDPEEVFSYETLMQQWKKYAKFGIFIGIMLLKAMLSDADEVPELGDMKDGDNLANMFTFGEEKEQQYRKRAIDVVEFLVDHDLM